MKINFESELEALLNKHSVENESDTPDFLLARFVMGCLDAYRVAVKARDQWYRFEPWGHHDAPLAPPAGEEVGR